MHKQKPFKSCFCTVTAAIMFSAASMAHAADENVLPTAGDTIETYWSAKFWTVFKNS